MHNNERSFYMQSASPQHAEFKITHICRIQKAQTFASVADCFIVVATVVYNYHNSHC